MRHLQAHRPIPGLNVRNKSDAVSDGKLKPSRTMSMFFLWYAVEQLLTACCQSLNLRVFQYCLSYTVFFPGNVLISSQVVSALSWGGISTDCPNKKMGPPIFSFHCSISLLAQTTERKRVHTECTKTCLKLNPSAMALRVVRSLQFSSLACGRETLTKGFNTERRA